MPAAPAAEYSVANANRFGWASVTGALDRGRLQLLDRCVVGARVLDAGCGGGGYADHLAGAGKDVVGVDKHDMFLGVARDRAFRGKFVQADLTDRLPFADAEFDTTYCFDVLEHVDDAAALRELARVTRRRLIVAVPHEDRRPDRYLLTYCPYLDQTHLRYYTADSLRALAATVDPERVEIIPESRVPLETLVQNEFRIASRVPVLGALYRRLFRFLAARAVGPDWHVGLVAVIDLRPRGGGT
jgi:SAM-dependent methyltransferase